MNPIKILHHYFAQNINQWIVILIGNSRNKPQLKWTRAIVIQIFEKLISMWIYHAKTIIPENCPLPALNVSNELSTAEKTQIQCKQNRKLIISLEFCADDVIGLYCKRDALHFTYVSQVWIIAATVKYIYVSQSIVAYSMSNKFNESCHSSCVQVNCANRWKLLFLHSFSFKMLFV